MMHHCSVGASWKLIRLQGGVVAFGIDAQRHQPCMRKQQEVAGIADQQTASVSTDIRYRFGEGCARLCLSTCKSLISGMFCRQSGGLTDYFAQRGA